MTNKSERELLQDALAYLPQFLELLNTQDNRATALPIWVAVQELKQVAVADQAYHEAGRRDYPGEETLWHYYHDDFRAEGFTQEEVLKEVKEYFSEDYDDHYDEDSDVEEEMVLVQYRYIDVQYFFTVKEAEDYIARDRHNLNKPRTYVHHFSYKNTEIRPLLLLLQKLPEIMTNLDWATHMLSSCGTGLTKATSDGIRSAYNFTELGVQNGNTEQQQH